MDLADAPVDVQLAAFERLVLANPLAVTVLDGLPLLGARGGLLAAGAVFQTVWNGLTGRDPAAGIQDYDVVYFDDGDLSWDAEDRVVRRAAEVFAGTGIDVEVRNQARVHLWYENRFGVP